MRVNQLKQWSAVLILPILIIAGCGSSSTDNNTGNDMVISVNRTELIPHGAQPVWVSNANQQFLFCYKQGEGDEGIYVSDLDLNITSLWTASQNHDYVPSPDGSKVAFSTPMLDGGVMVATISSGDVIMVLPGGTHPAWHDNSSLFAETEQGQIVLFGVENSDSSQISSSGLQPVANADGSSIVYYRSDFSLGLRLMWQTESGGSWSAEVSLASQVGTDAIFSPGGSLVYVSQLDTDNQSVVSSVPLANNPDATPILQAALRPSISGDGDELYANRISSNQPRSLWHTTLSQGDLGIILDASFAAAEASGKALLAESDWGIERITF